MPTWLHTFIMTTHSIINNYQLCDKNPSSLGSGGILLLPNVGSLAPAGFLALIMLGLGLFNGWTNFSWAPSPLYPRCTTLGWANPNPERLFMMLNVNPGGKFVMSLTSRLLSDLFFAATLEVFICFTPNSLHCFLIATEGLGTWVEVGAEAEELEFLGFVADFWADAEGLLSDGDSQSGNKSVVISKSISSDPACRFNFFIGGAESGVNLNGAGLSEINLCARLAAAPLGEFKAFAITSSFFLRLVIVVSALAKS